MKLPETSDLTRDSKRGFDFGIAFVFLLASASVLHALVGSSLIADERFALYNEGGLYGGNPLAAIGAALSEVPTYIERGNFRPLGRALDYLEHSTAYQLSVFANVPVNVVHGFFRITAAAVLGWLAFKVAEQYLVDDSPNLRALQLLLPASFALQIVAAGSSGPPLLFPWLYVITTALGVVLAYAIGQLVVNEHRLSIARAVTFLALGAMMASINEIAAVGLAIGAVHAVSLWFAHRGDRGASQGLSAWLIAFVGFLVVFVPSRVLIADACASGTCYAASDLGLSTWSGTLFLRRSVSAFFPIAWNFTNHLTGNQLSVSRIADFFFGYGGILLISTLGAGSFFLLRRKVRSGPVPGTRDTVRRLSGLLVFSISLPTSAALMASLSVGLQDADPPVGLVWRDSAYGFAGWSVFLIGMMLLAINLMPPRFRRTAVTVILIILVAMCSITAYLNRASADNYNQGFEAMLNNQIAASMVNFDRSDLGHSYRCSLLELWSAEYHDQKYAFRPQQLASALNRAAQTSHNQDYCQGRG